MPPSTIGDCEVEPAMVESIAKPVADTSVPVPMSVPRTPPPIVDSPVHNAMPGTDHVLCGGSLDGMIRLFPVYIADSINRIFNPKDNNVLTASIAMSFPNTASIVECQMTLYINSNKIDNLARDLFDVHLEVHAGLRYVYFAEGAKVLPNPRLTLRGCRVDMVSRIFGSDVFDAMTASPEYRTEVMHRRGRTECVSMVISHDANHEAEVSVSMGIVKGASIREELFN